MNLVECTTSRQHALDRKAAGAKEFAIDTRVTIAQSDAPNTERAASRRDFGIGPLWWRLSYACVFLVIALTASAQSTLPDDPVKPVVEKVCGGCHSFTVLSDNRATKDHWEAIVEKMVSRGAEGTDEELDQVVDYLSKHFGPDVPKKINVNKAAAAELVKTLAISQGNADAIVQYRAKNGAFKNLEALKSVPGIDAKQIEAKKEWIEF
jgi:competence protein ComEA